MFLISEAVGRHPHADIGGNGGKGLPPYKLQAIAHNLEQSRTGFLIPSVTFYADSDALTSHKTLTAKLQIQPRFIG